MFSLRGKGPYKNVCQLLSFDSRLRAGNNVPHIVTLGNKRYREQVKTSQNTYHYPIYCLMVLRKLL